MTTNLRNVYELTAALRRALDALDPVVLDAVAWANPEALAARLAQEGVIAACALTDEDAAEVLDRFVHGSEVVRDVLVEDLARVARGG